MKIDFKFPEIIKIYPHKEGWAIISKKGFYSFYFWGIRPHMLSIYAFKNRDIRLLHNGFTGMVDRYYRF